MAIEKSLLSNPEALKNWDKTLNKKNNSLNELIKESSNDIIPDIKYNFGDKVKYAKKDLGIGLVFKESTHNYYWVVFPEKEHHYYKNDRPCEMNAFPASDLILF